jgi:DNA-binding transcriptional ArsR family regulator
VKLAGHNRTRYEEKARLMKALAHPTRLFIVDELSRGERCVCDLRDMVGADISTVSKHLALLKTAGVVSDDKRGQQVFYRLRTPCVLNFFACVRQVQDAVRPVGSACVRS